MTIRDFDRWVILRLRFHQGYLWIEYEDEVGTLRSIPPYTAVQPLPQGWLQTAVSLPDFGGQGCLVPQDLKSLFESGFPDQAMYRVRQSSDGNRIYVPWLLPVFIDPPLGLETFAWEEILAGILLPVRMPEDCVLLRLARRTWKPRPAVQLPLTVQDASGPGADWLAALRAAPWYAKEAAVQTHGLRLEQWQNRLPGHIILAPLDGAERLLKSSPAIGSASSRLRLVVVVDHLLLQLALARLLFKIPASCSILILNPMGGIASGGGDPLAGELIKEMVYALVHDFALHDLVWILRQQFPGVSVFLASDPAALHDLRISRTMRQMVDEAFSLVHPVMGGDITAFSSRLNKDLASALKPFLDKVRPDWDVLTRHKSSAHSLSFDFSHKSRGLNYEVRTVRPDWDVLTKHKSSNISFSVDVSHESRGFTKMAHFSMGKSAAEEASSRLTEELKALPCAPECVLEIGQSQMRRADVLLEEYDAFGVLRPMEEDDRHRALRAGWRYRLRVHIGQRDENSIMEGPVTDVDLLLPPIDEKERYEIDVVVYEKSFGLLSAGIQKLELPARVSGSKPVYFELRAPLNPGLADLRLALYLRNCLLQSFVVEAEVSLEAERPWRPETQFRARQTFSSTTRFGNLDELSDPAISIALNQDPGGTHTLMLKGGAVSQSLNVTEGQITKHMGDFRSLLEEASVDGQQPRFPIDEPPSPAKEQEFGAYLRRLAQIGSGIWEMLMEQATGKKTCEALNQLLVERGLTAQFIRHGTNLPFPWQLVYDYPLPEGNDFLKSKVCLANGPRQQPASRRMQGCPHCPGEAVICIEGFWSARHCLEQLSERPGDRAPGTPRDPETLSEDLVTTISVPAANPLVWLGTGVKDQSTEDLHTHLDQGLVGGLRLLTPQDDLVHDVLWNDAQRPGLLIVISHLEPADEARNLPPRILPVILPQGFAVDRHLTRTILLSAKVELNPWSTGPRPLVLLMACQSAQTGLADLTNFIDTFMGVGAAGIVGTENSVCSDLAALFAEHLVLGMIKQGLCLGEVRRSFTLEMLRRGNPLPFSFTVFGSANLIIERMEKP